MTGLILGIDPGLTGALAWLNRSGALCAVQDMPVLAGEISASLLMDLPIHDVTVAVLEWPGLMPARDRNGNPLRMNQKSVRSTGMSLATLSTFLTVNGIATHRITPGVWKRAMNLDADKTKSCALAMRLWPEWADRFKRVKDHGRAEAALLAHWWLTKPGADVTVSVLDNGEGR